MSRLSFYELNTEDQQCQTLVSNEKTPPFSGNCLSFKVVFALLLKIIFAGCFAEVIHHNKSIVILAP
jgi:hypothetical protein